MLSYLAAGAAFAFAASVQPGPMMTFIISQAMEKGWRRAMPISLAPILSDGPIIILVLILLSQVPDWFVRFLHFGGAALLLFLAYGAYKSWRTYDENALPSNDSGAKTLLKAIMVNLLNPNPYLAWSLILGPIFLKGYSAAPANGIGMLLGFYITFTICLIVQIFLFGSAKKLGSKVTHTMLGLSVIALAAFAVYQFWLGITAA